jgi:NADP-dependent 3-hydroxy acid dehydrogenase YdfG
MSKIALITGATAGIGEACARLFAQQKYDLILTGRRTERLSVLADDLTAKYGIQVKLLTMDVRNKEEVEILETLSEDWKKVDVLINNAGLSQGMDPINAGSTAEIFPTVNGAASFAGVMVQVKLLEVSTRLMFGFIAEKLLANTFSMFVKSSFPGSPTLKFPRPPTKASPIAAN